MTSPRRGRFVVFEGIDGSGKSSTLAMIAKALASDGLDPLATREESAGPSGEWVRRSITEGWPPLATLHLFVADRVRHVGAEIEPALAAGRPVLCDRFLHSTLAYQSVTLGGALSMEQMRRMHDGWCPLPDRVLLFDADPVKAVARTTGRSARSPYEKAEFLGKVRRAYLELAKTEPERFTILDADQDAAALARDALAAVRKALA